MGEPAKVYDFTPRQEKREPRQYDTQVHFIPEEEKRAAMRPRFMNPPRPWYEGLMDGVGASILFLVIMMVLGMVFKHISQIQGW